MIFRLLWLLDEWAHRRGLISVNGTRYGPLYLRPFGWICDWIDRELIGE